MRTLYAHGSRVRVLDWGDASISHPFAVSYDQNSAAAAGSDELVQTSVALPLAEWMTWTTLS